ncbi:hypothetical protein VSAK1_22969 [Vibrio mediterranei AK1]|nr:hypothetical protein VSAK1_22969 [Vibrio mediterranei AK1]
MKEKSAASLAQETTLNWINLSVLGSLGEQDGSCHSKVQGDRFDYLH